MQNIWIDFDLWKMLRDMPANAKSNFLENHNLIAPIFLSSNAFEHRINNLISFETILHDFLVLVRRFTKTRKDFYKISNIRFTKPLLSKKLSIFFCFPLLHSISIC